MERTSVIDLLKKEFTWALLSLEKLNWEKDFLQIENDFSEDFQSFYLQIRHEMVIKG